MATHSDGLAELRKPFPPDEIGKLPKSTCRDCSNSQRKRCDNHAWVSNCKECHGSHSNATMHLDFVGHADLTARLLSVDPEWTWEPMAVDQFGMPLMDHGGNLWIRLTVLGVTRIGVGDGKNGKECIGDALRNAGMRFGVALDLWAKGDRSWAHAEDETPERPMADPSGGQLRERTPEDFTVNGDEVVWSAEDLKEEIRTLAGNRAKQILIAEEWEKVYHHPLKTAVDVQALTALRDDLRREKAKTP